MLSLVISVTYLNLTFFSLDVCILLWNMDLFSTITDGAVWLMTESIFALALSMNRRISLFALSEPWYTLVNDGLVLGPSIGNSSEFVLLVLLLEFLLLSELL